jgi:RimJ/RimL family protein N-acetyltransferase
MELRPSYPVRSARLLLRPLSVADIDALVSYRSLEEVCRYLPFEPMDVEVVKDRLARGWSTRAISKEGDALTLGVELADSGELIGDVMLCFKQAAHSGGEIGWVLHPAYSGHGYATEAADALLHLAFDQLGLHRVVARIIAPNAASVRVAERLGMRREAHLLSNEWFKGAWIDEVDYALLADEWTARHGGGPVPLASEDESVRRN